ncbi:NADH:ubiquinone reductase (Na(+)-transporting) subunit B [bacterium]|nr:MAG: NADH:ubiquinone reductase (Na(+)-transporting) subunit B [bacterium]|tara:strand:- start:3528 stop:4793 length:1266 start_codon:yes stop_codon:yes gene_type:complete
MKFLRNILDKIEPLFTKGGKLESLYPLYEAGDTFLYTPNEKTKKPPFVRDNIDLKRTMILVVLALLPCLLFGIFNVGHQYYHFVETTTEATVLDKILIGLQSVIPIYIVAFTVGGLTEVIFAIIRKHEVNEGFLVTGFLIPLVMPPSLPLWMVAISTIFGVVIGKEIFGGTGYNIFNPALVARVFAFFAYPTALSGDTVWVYKMPETDGLSAATSLLASAKESVSSYSVPDYGLFSFLNGSLHNQFVDVTNSLGQTHVDVDLSWTSLFLGLIPGSIGETSTLAVLLGAGLIAITGVGSKKIILSTTLGMVITSFLLYMFGALIGSTNPMMYLPPHYHFVMGSFAFAMIFMATEPVTSAHSQKGKLYYGLLIGFMCVIIRAINPAYPEGMMLGILFANAFAPLIDYYVVESHIQKRKRRYAR